MFYPHFQTEKRETYKILSRLTEETFLSGKVSQGKVLSLRHGIELNLRIFRCQI